MLRRTSLCAVVCFTLSSVPARAVDLFDFLPLDAFWKSQNVSVSGKTMTDLLADVPATNISELIKQLGSERFIDREKAYSALKGAGASILPQLEKAAKESTDVEIRQRLGQLVEAISVRAANRATLQMAAIRTVQQRKMKEALPALRKLAESERSLIASYAEEAIAALEGKPYRRPESTDEMLAADLALLPYDCGMVAQVRGSNAELGDVYKMIAGMPYGGTREVEMMQRELVKIAMRIGNVRADSMTLGVSDDFGPRAGYGVFVFRGRGSKDALERFIRDEGRLKEPVEINGVKVWRPDREVAMILPSNDRLVFVVSDREQYLPLGRITRSIKSPPKDIQLNPTMRDLISKVDRKKAAWGVAKVTSIFRGELPPLAPFDWIVGEIDQDESGALSARFAGYGPDAEAIAASLRNTNAFLATLVASTEELPKKSPVAKPVVDGLKSIRLTSKDNQASLTLGTNNATTAVFAPLIIDYAARGTRRLDRPRPAVGRVGGIPPARAAVREVEIRALMEAKRAEAAAAARVRADKLRALDALRKLEETHRKAEAAAKDTAKPEADAKAK